MSFFKVFLKQGSFPYEWDKSIIIPIHKKGDINKCDKFRPISLTSLLSKVYTNILNRRLTLFTDAFGLLPEEQAGLRGYSIVDHIFSVVQKQFSKNQKLYVAFIDY